MLMQSIGDIVRTRAQQHEQPLAMVFEGRRTTYVELDERSNRAAHALLAATTNDERIGILDTNSDCFFEILLGAAKAARVLVPLNYRLAMAELAAVTADAGIGLLFVGAAFVDLIDPLRRLCPAIRQVIVLADGRETAPSYPAWRDAHPDADPALPSERSRVVLQVYTSGTVGLPKGVLLTNGSLLAGVPMLMNEYRCNPARDVGLVCMPMYHVSGCLWGLTCMYSGVAMVVLCRPTPLDIFTAIARHRVSFTLVVPALIQLLLGAPERSQFDLSSLRLLLYGASPIPLPLLQHALTAFACDFGQIYGLTESGGAVTYLPPEDHDARNPQRLRSCGKALRQAVLRAVDETGADVPTGTVGEIICRSPQNMVGYWHRRADSEAALRDGWLHTGDLGYVDQDGYWYVLDRLDDMIITGGENVFPAEVEGPLLTHPAVADVAAVGVPDEQWGQRVAAFVVLKAHATTTADELNAFVSERLSSYKVPKTIQFLPVLPRNAAGKLLRRALRPPLPQRASE